MNKKAITKINVGVLVLIILTSSMYFYLESDDGEFKFGVDKYKAFFKVKEDGKFNTVSEMYMRLYDRSTGKRINAESRVFYWINFTDYVVATVGAKYKNNITTIMSFRFNKRNDSIESYPEKTEHLCINCQGKRVEFWITKIRYSGETKDITSPFEYDPNMK